MATIPVADASVAIRGDMSGFHKDLKGAERSTQTLGQKLNEALTPKGILKAGALFGIGQSLPAIAGQLLGFAGDASEAFIAVERSVKSVDQIFGESASVIEDWADRAADAAGLSKRKVNENAAVMGQTFQNLGFDAGESAANVVKLQQRGADLAATFNGETSDAINAISSLLRGERDPIEKFGVTISEADVQARILALGLDTSTAAAKRHAKSVATLELFYEQSADSAGRFADSTDDVGLAMDKAQAKIENGMLVAGGWVAAVQLAAIETGEETAKEFETIGEWWNLAFGTDEQQTAAAQFFDGVGDGASEAAAALEAMTAAHVENASEVNRAWVTQIPLVDDAVTEIATLPRRRMAEEWAALRDAAYQSQVEIAKGLMDGQNEPQVAMDAAMQILNDELTDEQEIARLEGQKITLEAAAGVASREGKDAALIAINGALDVVTRRLATVKSSFYQGGYNLGVSWANGLRSSADWARLMAWEVAAAASGPLHGLSPPKEGPLHTIDKGGFNVGKAWAQGLGGAASVGRAEAAVLASSVSGLLTSLGSAAPLGSLGGSMGGMSMGDININAPTVPMTSRDIGRELRRTGAFGSG